MTPNERLRIFILLMKQLPPSSSEDEAINLVRSTMDAVEDEFSGLPNDPASWNVPPPRLYPPQDDERSAVNPSLARYRTKGHYMFIAKNGAIRIESKHGNKEVLLDKSGSDGRMVKSYE